MAIVTYFLRPGIECILALRGVPKYSAFREQEDNIYLNKNMWFATFFFIYSLST